MEKHSHHTEGALSSFEDAEDVRMYADLGIPDGILKTFDEKYHIDEMLKDPKQFSERVLAKYSFQGLTYVGTVKNFRFLHSGQYELMVKLSHDGFRYTTRRFSKSQVHWHKRNDFFLLTADVFREMPYLRNLKTKLKAELFVYYSIKSKRLDIAFHKSVEDDDPFLLVTFEHGLPQHVPSSEFMV